MGLSPDKKCLTALAAIASCRMTSAICKKRGFNQNELLMKSAVSEKKLLVNEVHLVYNRPAIDDLIQVTKSEESYAVLQTLYPEDRLCYKEFFYCLFLNRANYVLAATKLSEGGMTGTFVEVREILQIALKTAACALILSHNHPSGNLKPSACDHRLTKKVIQAAELLDIQVLDHLIITQEGYYSFADEGVL
ncbi:MAG: JAB domain-containing protein [Owenweeksia sp.]